MSSSTDISEKTLGSVRGILESHVARVLRRASWR